MRGTSYNVYFTTYIQYSMIPIPEAACKLRNTMWLNVLYATDILTRGQYKRITYGFPSPRCKLQPTVLNFAQITHIASPSLGSNAYVSANI